MFSWLKKFWSRPETKEEREFRQKAHKGILASSAGLVGVGRVEEDNEDNKVCDGSNPNG
jgi:hypothetical protein